MLLFCRKWFFIMKLGLLWSPNFIYNYWGKLVVTPRSAPRVSLEQILASRHVLLCVRERTGNQ